MAEYLQALMLTYTAFIFAVLSPGPNVFGVLNTTLEKGRTAGMLFGLGIAFGSLTWAAFSVIGLTQVVAKYSMLLTLIKILGGCYLLYLAFRAFKSSKEVVPFNVNQVPGNRSKRSLLSGYLLMMTNPKAALAWVAIVSMSTFSGAPAWVSLAAVFGTFILSVLIHISYALIFGNRLFIDFYSKAREGLLKTFSVVYGGLGLKLLTSTN